jgi:hypothetical protein
MQISLEAVAQTQHLIGSEFGRQTYHTLYDLLSEQPMEKLVAISAANIQRMDATFARESLVALAKRFQGQRVLCLIDFDDRDHLDNCSYAAQKEEVTFLAWQGAEYQVIGQQLSKSWKRILDFVQTNGTSTTNDVVRALNISIQNAGVTMKKMVEQGLLIREDGVTVTGGRECHYQTVKPPR